MTDKPDQAASPTSSDDSDSASSTEESEAGDHVESLVTGRAKRVTAGKHVSTLIEKEKDDVVELLFAEGEQEEDDSFDEDEEDASDVNLGSSSSDEEDGEGSKDQDDLLGEKELQRQARQETKKRKAKDREKLPGVARKRVKIDPTAMKPSSELQPRPKKKSERISWVASAADAPTRVSSRKQTVKNRETVHKRLVDSEKQRKKLMRQMEEAQKRKEASKPKALTQAQRLEEAAKMEKKNAKSLTRWEESEKKRVAEQKAKLEALHNRQLSGPVITLWSGLARWVNSKVAQLGVKEIRAAGNRDEPNKLREEEAVIVTSTSEQREDASIDPGKTMADTNEPEPHPNRPNPQQYSNGTQSPYPQPLQFAPPQGPYGFLHGIHAYAALPTQNKAEEPVTISQGGPPPSHSRSSTTTFQHTAPLAQPLPHQKPEIEYTSQNLVALKNVDANAQKLSELQHSALIKKQKLKLQKASPEQCAITGQQASFREPVTGLPYANASAYKEIRRLQKGSFRWSNLLECYVGSTTTTARGVPEPFHQQT